MVETRRIELLTPCLQGRCSPSWATPPFACLFVTLLCCSSSPSVDVCFYTSRSGSSSRRVLWQKSCAKSLSNMRCCSSLPSVSVCIYTLRSGASSRLACQQNNCASFLLSQYFVALSRIVLHQNSCAIYYAILPIGKITAHICWRNLSVFPQN